MKKKLIQIYLTGTLLLVILIGGWIYGNVRTIGDEHPERAALGFLLDLHSESLEAEEITFVPIEYSSSIPAGPKILFSANQDGKGIAEVEVTSFLGIGWQLSRYERK